MKAIVTALIFSSFSIAFAAEFKTADYALSGCEIVKCAADKPLTANETEMSCAIVGGSRTISITKKDGYIMKSTELVVKEKFKEGSHKSLPNWSYELKPGVLTERYTENGDVVISRLAQADKALHFEVTSLYKGMGATKATVHRFVRCVFQAD